jgi:hypothetical protein
MIDQKTTIVIEIPSNITQQEVWDLEEQLKGIEGLETDLQESRDIIAPTLLILHFIVAIMGSVVTIGGGIKSIHDVAKLIYDFLHSKDNESKNHEFKRKIVITKKGKKFEIYSLSVEEIEKLLKDE